MVLPAQLAEDSIQNFSKDLPTTTRPHPIKCDKNKDFVYPRLSGIPIHPAIRRIKYEYSLSKRKLLSADRGRSTNDTNMPRPSSRRSSEESSSGSPGGPSKKARAGLKPADWSEVTNPEERRRIQNRIAQRKFREKAKENRETAEREAKNRDNAGNSYQVPRGSDISTGEGLSGLPWGSVNLNHCVTRGHEAQSRRSSGQNTFIGDEVLVSGQYGNNYGEGRMRDLTHHATNTASAAFMYDSQLATYHLQGV